MIGSFYSGSRIKGQVQTTNEVDIFLSFAVGKVYLNESSIGLI